jgi:6-phosphogluconolactonase (cycloisomerase 2 family)
MSYQSIIIHKSEYKEEKMVALSVGKKRKLVVLSSMLVKTVWAVGLVALLVSCGEGPGYNYTVGGTVSGLAGSGLVLQNNAGGDRSISADGVFSFATPVNTGAAYAVTVKTQPSVFPQTCTVSNGSGTINDAPVYNVVVSCVTPQRPVTVDPSGNFAYAANVVKSTISVYTISSGELTHLQTIGAGTTPYSVTVHPSLEFAYVASYSDNTIWVYDIAADGTLTAKQTVNVGAGTNPTSVTIHPSLEFAYVANVGNNTISVYAIAADGTLTAKQTVNVGAGTNSTSVTIHPSLEFAYAANMGDNTISVYTINSGLLTHLQTIDAGVSPGGTGVSPVSVTVDPLGTFAYVANEGDNTISVYTISSGELTALQTIGTGVSPVSVTVDRLGTFAYVANEGDNTISVYSINSGLLTALQTIVAGVSPVSVTVHPSGNFAYAANVGDNTISVYTIGSGLLTAVGTAVPIQ